MPQRDDDAVVGPGQQTAETMDESQLFGAVARSARDPVVVTSPGGTIMAWNPAATRSFGYERSEAIGQSIDLIVPDAYRYDMRILLARIADGQTVGLYDAIRRCKDGRLINVTTSVTPVFDGAGALIGVAMIGRDNSLGNLGATKFRLAVEASPNGLLMVDGRGTILMANREMERLFGYGPDELVGMPTEQLLPLRFRQAHVSLRKQFSDTGDEGNRAMGAGRDLFGLRKDGTEFPVEVGLNRSASPEGPLIVASVVDITDRKRTETALIAQASELRRSNADLEQFAYVASHDLQEPLRMVASYTQLLAERYRGKLDERADKYINYTIEGARRMQSLVRDLLAYSRLTTREPPPRTQVDTTALVKRVLGELSQLVEEAGAAVTVDPLPKVLGNENELGLVFQNLIANAVKFRGSEPPAVHISARKSNGCWEFLIQDNGIGIDVRYHERIFQMFQRLHERGKYEGNGIGLAVSKKIIEQHGGSIWVKAASGKGSSFFFTIRTSTEAQ